MPVTMDGSPRPAPHWKAHDEEKYFGHAAVKSVRSRREAEFKARQEERMRQEALHAEYEKEKRKEMTARLEKRLEFEPGYVCMQPPHAHASCTFLAALAKESATAVLQQSPHAFIPGEPLLLSRLLTSLMFPVDGPFRPPS